MTEATLVMDARDVVGESAVWSVARQELLWVDIVGRRIHRLDPRTGRHRLHPVHQFPTSIGLTRGGGAIVGCTKSVMLWDLEDTFTRIAIVEPELPDRTIG
jgi:sugar lactone lactonase YvrE